MRSNPSIWKLFALALAATLPSTAEQLFSLSLTSGPLSPWFNPATYSYTASVASTVTSVRVRPIATVPATIRINGAPRLAGSGTYSAPINLVPGPNTITISVTGLQTHTYTVVVTRATGASNTPPSVWITAPYTATAINAGQAFTFGATASDVQDGNLSPAIRWTSSINGDLGTGASVNAANLSPGVHAITAAVTDAAGASAQTSVAVTVNAAPIVSILSPSNGSNATQGTEIKFTATATDAEDGDLTSAIEWNAGNGLLATGSYTALNGLPVGNHTITASVKDSRGMARSASVSVDVKPAVRPNILLIVADDLGAEATSLYPSLAGRTGDVPMPNLERLAAGGLVFNNAWATPLCSPTRAAMLTGLHGNRTGVLNVGEVLSTNITNIFDTISGQSPARYNIGVFGKWHLGGPVGSAQHVRNSGVPTYKGILSGGVEDYYNWTSTDQNGVATNVRTYATSTITDYAIDFIQQHESTRPLDPWFVYVPYNAPHYPNQVPPASLHSVNLNGLQPGTVSDTVPVYKAMIQALDTEMGRLLNAVNLSNTVVIFVGDNGTAANVKDSPSGVRNSKQTVYEGGVRVPLVIAGAGVARTGREDALVSITDLYATLMTLAGIPTPQINQSYSLTPLLDGSGSSGRVHSYTELCGSGYNGFATRDARHKLMYANGIWALYDLLSDPLETTNLYNSPAYATIRANLRETLVSMKAAAIDGCFPASL